jgi:hypothetical protein
MRAAYVFHKNEPGEHPLGYMCTVMYVHLAVCVAIKLGLINEGINAVWDREEWLDGFGLGTLDDSIMPNNSNE